MIRAKMTRPKILLASSLSLAALTSVTAQAQDQGFDLWGTGLTISPALVEYETGSILPFDDGGNTRTANSGVMLTTNISGQMGPVRVDIDLNWLEPSYTEGNLSIEGAFGKLNLGSDKATTVPEADDRLEDFSSIYNIYSLYDPFTNSNIFIGGANAVRAQLDDDATLSYANLSYFSPTTSGISYGASYNSYAVGAGIRYEGQGIELAADYEAGLFSRGDNYVFRYLASFTSDKFSIEAIFETGRNNGNDKADETAVTLSYDNYSLVLYEDSEGGKRTGISAEFDNLKLFAGVSESPASWTDGVTLRAEMARNQIDYTVEYIAYEAGASSATSQEFLILGIAPQSQPYEFNISLGELNGEASIGVGVNISYQF